MRVETILTPAEIATLPARDLGGSICVVFDVLRATSTILTAFAHGARRIYPVRTVEEARRLHRDRLPEALLGGERNGVRIEGFQLGNSPQEYTRETVADRDIITTTTNGTIALCACAGAVEVLAGAWLNLDAMAAYLHGKGESLRRLLLVCAGTGDGFALEDGLAAGALLARFTEKGLEIDDASQVVAALYQAAGTDPLQTMRQAENGRKLIQTSLGADVEWCAHATSIPWIGTMQGEALEGACIALERLAARERVTGSAAGGRS